MTDTQRFTERPDWATVCAWEDAGRPDLPQADAAPAGEGSEDV